MTIRMISGSVGLVLGLVLLTFAQGIRFQNEIQGYKLYGKGKLNGIALKTSTRADVEAAFGTDCEWRFCPYDDKWEVMFIYLGDMWPEETRVEGEFKYTLAQSPEYVDHLWYIQFKPKETISFANITFPTAFVKERNTMMHSGTSVLDFRDGSGLFYRISDEEFGKGTLITVSYRIPEKDQADAFFIVGKKDAEFDPNK